MMSSALGSSTRALLLSQALRKQRLDPLWLVVLSNLYSALGVGAETAACTGVAQARDESDLAAGSDELGNYLEVEWSCPVFDDT